MMVGNSRNSLIDALKGIACLFVIFIHRMFPGTFGVIVSGIARSAVAIFFMISGYYAYYSEEDEYVNKIPKKIKHIVKILLFSLLYYFVWECFIRWFGSGISSVKEWITTHIFSFRTWYLAVIWDYDPLAGHLWFLFSLIRVYCIYYLLCRYKLLRFKKAIIVVSTIMLFLLQWGKMDLYYYRNGWIYGLPFFMLGYLIRKGWKITEKTTPLLVAGIVLTIIESCLLPLMQMYVGCIFICIGIFYKTINQEIKQSSIISNLSVLGKKYSTLVYVIHWAIKEVFVKIDKTFSFAEQLWFQWISPVLLAVISVLASILLYELLEFFKQKYEVKFL